MRRRKKSTAEAAAARPAQEPGTGDVGEKPIPSADAARRGSPDVQRGAPAARLQRRLILIDVENTSSESELVEILGVLEIDHSAQQIEVLAAGNWRTISAQVARRLASLGARLLHTAPAPGVRDWSDLGLAVESGLWMAHAAPGDSLVIVSDDRAFDAVGDAAAQRGVVFRRLQRHGAAAAAPRKSTPPKSGRGTRRGVPRERAETVPTADRTSERPAEPSAPHTAHSPRAEADPHGANREQTLSLIRELSGAQTGRWLTLDAVGEALKARGFQRTPGSPRLVTWLRTLKELEVSAKGQVRLRHGQSANV